MKSKIIAVLIVLMLATSSIVMVSHVQTTEALPTPTPTPGPSLIINDTINRANATLGIMTGSQITAKGTIKNIGNTTLTNLLTGVFFIEGTGVLVPPDFSFEFSFDCIAWIPIDPSEVKVPTGAAWPMQVELPIGSPGGETLAPNATLTMYLRITLNNNMTPMPWPNDFVQSMIVWVYGDANLNRQYDGGEMIYSQPPAFAGLIDWDNPVRIDLAIVHTAEIAGTGRFYYSIQSAINAANPGDTIWVYPGTYNEQVDINKSVSVIGTAGATQTFIDAVGLPAGPGAFVLVKIDTTGNVLFQGFTVQMRGNAASDREGILTQCLGASPTYTIVNNRIYGTNNTLDDQDYGFYAQSGQENIVFSNNIISRTGANNIVLEKHTGATEISHNTLDAGAYGTDSIFAMTYDGADVTTLQRVSYNTFNMGTGEAFDYAHRSTAISFNTPGAAWGLGDAKFTNVVIQENAISIVKSNGRGIGFWNGGGGGGGVIAPLMQGNTITGVAGSTDSYGIDFVGTGAATYAIVLYNSISKCAQGVYLRTDGCAPGLTVHYNNIRDCAAGVNNTIGTTNADARFNYWGSANGPYHSTNPSGTKTCNVTDNVLFNPWTQYAYPAPPPETHDMFISCVTATPNVFATGTTIHIEALVINVGTYFEENVTVTFKVDSNTINTTILRYVAPPITVGPASWYNIITFDYDTTGLSSGTHLLNAMVTPVPSETNTANNFGTTGIFAGTGQFPTLQAPIVRMQRLDKTFTVNITVNNLLAVWQAVGYQYLLTWNPELIELVGVTEGPFLPDARWNFYGTFFAPEFLTNSAGQNTSVLIGQLLLPDSNGHTTVFPYGDGVLAILTFKALQQESGIWRPPLACNLTLTETLVLNPDTLVIPASVQNGRFEMWPENTVDINHDYKVDMKDIGPAARAFGTIPGDPRWNPAADITGPTTWVPDGKIDMRDLGLIARNFGWEAIDP